MIEKNKAADTLATIIMLIGIAFILFPVTIAVITATLSYQDFLQAGGIGFNIGTSFFDNRHRIFTETKLPIQLLNSIVTSLMVAFIKCIFAFMATFALVFFNSRLNKFIFALILVTITMPVDLIVITTYQVVANIAMPINWVANFFGANLHLQVNLLDSYIGIAAPLATNSTSVFIYRQFFLSLPKDLPKAAKMDGAGPVRFMIDILLPLSKTPLVATFILWFIGAWTSYLWPLVASSNPETQTAVVGLAKLVTQEVDYIPDIPLMMTGAIFVSFIPIILVALMQKKIIQGMNLSEK